MPTSMKDVHAALALSRETLRDPQNARKYTDALNDAQALLDLSTRMLSLPMVARHLRDISPGWFDPEATQQLELKFTLSHVVLKSELKAFHNQIIAPEGIDHAYLKGFALAHSFFERSSLRYARDIDVLIRRQDLPRVVNLARAAGYSLLNTVDPTRFLETEQDIRAALRYQKVVNLISPQGHHIEVHLEIDKQQGIFDEAQLIQDAQKTEIGDLTVSTVPPVDHFIYVAYHAARHNWSRLHWLADLDAMAHSPMIPRDDLLRRARDMGLEALMQETLGFVELSRNPAAVTPGIPGARILDRVQEILMHGDQRVAQFSNAQVATALPFPDLLAPWLRGRIKRRRFWGRVQPQIADYHAWPLPDHLQWLYRVVGPAGRILRKKLS